MAQWNGPNECDGDVTDLRRCVVRISILGSGSDYASFVALAGVPCIDVRYTHNYPISSYPLYHSVYETRYLVTRFMDPQFAVRSLTGWRWFGVAVASFVA